MNALAPLDRSAPAAATAAAPAHAPADPTSPLAAEAAAQIVPAAAAAPVAPVAPVAPDQAVLNIAAYRFVSLDNLPALQQRLRSSAEQRGLKGTVLLAPEGINLFLAGRPEAVDGWLEALADDPRLAGLTVKRSTSRAVPFARLKVKCKREIVRMNLPTLRPATARPPGVAPRTLARWLQQGHCDAGRPVLMLDTRNGFEVDMGAFEDAIDWRLDKFTDFPQALAAHRERLAGATVVSYCTGGIRCEKAALVMQDMGLTQALQLDGGILQYFEDTGGQAPGWRGRCFVFDGREGLDPTLQPAR